MKRIVIVDDRPWRMQECIKGLQKKGVSFYKTIYYRNNEKSREDQGVLIDSYKAQTQIETIWVDSEREFMDEMDKVYSCSDIIFLMDYDLKGDMNPDDFFKRINVRYALNKDKDNKKIWFYTTGPADIKGLLLNTFPDRIIGVSSYVGGQSYWKEEQVLEAVSERE